MAQPLPSTLPPAEKQHWAKILQRCQKAGYKLPEPGGPQKKWGRMMQICLTSRMFAESKVNNFGLATFALQHVPDAICIIRTGRGSFLRYHGE